MNKEELRDKILRMNKEASEMPLGELCEHVLKGSFTPGIHDIILLERCRGKCKCKGHKKEETSEARQLDLPFVCG